MMPQPPQQPEHSSAGHIAIFTCITSRIRERRSSNQFAHIKEQKAQALLYRISQKKRTSLTHTLTPSAHSNKSLSRTLPLPRYVSMLIRRSARHQFGRSKNPANSALHLYLRHAYATPDCIFCRDAQVSPIPKKTQPPPQLPVPSLPPPSCKHTSRETTRTDSAAPHRTSAVAPLIVTPGRELCLNINTPSCKLGNRRQRGKEAKRQRKQRSHLAHTDCGSGQASCRCPRCPRVFHCSRYLARAGT
jgi:hypothetical protein